MAKDKRIFQVAASLEGVSPRKDGGMGLRFITQEIPEKEKLLLMSFFNKFGWVLFSEDEIQEADIPEKNTDIEGRKVKTPSQRLRAVIWLLAKQDGIADNDQIGHDEFYVKKMEDLINWAKAKLDN